MKVITLILSSIILLTIVNYSQVTQNITASGAVYTPVTYEVIRNLRLFPVFPGIPKTITNDDGTYAGQFILKGEGTKEIQTTITRPTELTGPASATMPINFTTGSGVIATAATSGGVKTIRAGDVTTNLNSGELFFFIGGSVFPSADQTFGDYSGSIGFSTVYTGN